MTFRPLRDLQLHGEVFNNSILLLLCQFLYICHHLLLMHVSIFHQLKILSMDLVSLQLSLLHRITLSNLIFLFQFMHNRWFFKRDPYLETYSKSINPKDLSMSVQYPHKLEYFLHLQYPYPFHFKWHEIETLSAFSLSDH